MHKLQLGTLPIPRLYICEDRQEGRKCRKLGVPYLIRPMGWDDEMIVKAILWSMLVKRFPHIKWAEVLGINARSQRAFKIKVPSDYRDNPGIDTCGESSPNMEVSDDYRPSDGGLDPASTLAKVEPEYLTCSIKDYVGNIEFQVDVQELQALKVLPTFLDDIATAIKRNIASVSWMDGYNKKLGIPSGTFQGADEAPNLIILDTSGSIPSGVAGTMIALIETLRNQANADLIITSGRSEYWAANEKLPDEKHLAYLIGGANECRQFYDILRKHVLGRHWGNVIVFGDNDAPTELRFSRHKDCWVTESELQNTQIDRIMAFHTYNNCVPGYGLWAKQAAPKAEVVINTKWVKCMDERY